MEKVTKEQRARWGELADSATPGRWEPVGEDRIGSFDGDGPIVAETYCIRVRQSEFPQYMHDANFIAAAREAVPALLAALEEQERLTALESAAASRLAGAVEQMRAKWRADVERLEQERDRFEDVLTPLTGMHECDVASLPAAAAAARDHTLMLEADLAEERRHVASLVAEVERLKRERDEAVSFVRAQADVARDTDRVLAEERRHVESHAAKIARLRQVIDAQRNLIIAQRKQLDLLSRIVDVREDGAR